MESRFDRQTGQRVKHGSTWMSGGTLRAVRTFDQQRMEGILFMDQTRDLSGRQLYRINQLYGPPEFVKNASISELCGEEGQLPPHVYGDPRHNLFPCHTAAATWTSMAFFQEKKAEFRRDDAQLIEARILHAAKVHGIERSVEALIEKIAQAKHGTEAELSDDDFALVVGSERHYPMRNPTEITKAAAYLLRWRHKMPFDMRQQMADKIMCKAAAVGVKFDDETRYELEKQAGYGTCTSRECADLILSRVYASRKGPGPETPEQAALIKLAETITKSPSKIREPGALVKIAATIDMFDRKYGLVTQYGKDFPRPEDVLFGITGEKMASVAREHCSTTTGNIYRLSDLEKVKIAKVRDLLGDDFANAITSDGIHIDSEKAAEIVPTMDRGFADLFDKLMLQAGVRPIAKEASAESIKISREYLRELATRYQAVCG